MTTASLRPAPSRWFATLLTASLILILVAGSTAGAETEGFTAAPDAGEIVRDTLASLETAGSYRFLRYDVLNNRHHPNLLGEVDLARGGRFISLDDGTISTTNVDDPSTLDDAVLRFFTSRGEGWVFDRIETGEGGATGYVLVEIPPAEVGGRKVRVSFLVIDAETYLPVRSRQYGTDQVGPYAYESTYFDFGDAVQLARAVATPGPATPLATAGCGSQKSGPTEVAEVFMAGAIDLDLMRAAACFSPNRQPRDWGDVFLGATRDDFVDITGCQGVPYVVSESAIRSDFSAVIFTFDEACAIANLDPWQSDLYDSETLPVTTMIVQTHLVDGRWYVQDAYAMVPD